MELFRQINNEALDEDMKIRREVIERLKKQVGLFNQTYKAPAELSDTILNNIQRYVINFDDTLNKTLNDAYGKEEKEDTGDLVLNYNLLANYLEKINYKLLGASDKIDIMEIMDELLPKIGKIVSIIKTKDYNDADLVEKIYNNFKNHTYNIILEKERNIIQKEASKQKNTKLIDIGEEKPTEITSEGQLKTNLGRLLESIRKYMVENPKASNLKTAEKHRNKARTLLDEVNSGNYDLSDVSKFISKYTPKYIKSPEASLIDLGTTEGNQTPLSPLKKAPLLQQGAEETTTMLPQEEGSGKPRRYYKRF
jgi:hypothetical protein